VSLDTTAIVAAVASHALASGYFDRVGRHEPKNAPGNGLSAAIWVDRIAPLPGSSGLAVTAGLLVVQLRIYQNMLYEPQDSIDPNLAAAVDGLMTAYSGDFDLGATVRNIDLLGQYGEGLTAQAGYIEQDGKLYRVMTLSIPIIVNDIWSQSA